jgi:hypothetical protein
MSLYRPRALLDSATPLTDRLIFAFSDLRNRTFRTRNGLCRVCGFLLFEISGVP